MLVIFNKLNTKEMRKKVMIQPLDDQPIIQQNYACIFIPVIPM